MIDPGGRSRSTRLPRDGDRVRPRLRPAGDAAARGGRARGLRAANGSEMLIQQAAIAFERWTGSGMAGMADVMRRPPTRRTAACADTTGDGPRRAMRPEVVREIRWRHLHDRA